MVTLQRLWSDLGSQLTGASKELKQMITNLNKEKLLAFSTDKGIDWSFAPGDAPWYNGCSEALIRSVKKAVLISIRSQILLYSELQTVFYKIANLLNERQIGRLQMDPLDVA